MIQKNSYKTILRNLFKKGYLKVMADKVLHRLKEPSIARQQKEASTWCEGVAINVEDFCKSIDSDLYVEAYNFNIQMNRDISERVQGLPVKMGGGGNVLLTYFLVRCLRPDVIVETGVSVGYTSRSFLEAIRTNQRGSLFSSDFPYFRLESPEKYIGWVVSEELKKDWKLFVKGDQANLPEILKQTDSVNLFHYDSDKSYAGRRRAWETVQPKLSNDFCAVFDDIGDNDHFKKEFYDKGIPCLILKTHIGGYIGVLGPIVERKSK